MPQLRWTLLCLGVLFVVLLAWIEHRRQRRQGFTEPPHVDKEAVGTEPTPSAMFREPALSLPEMRAARDAAPPHELPVVEIEEDSLNPRRVEPGQGRVEPPTLSLPVLESGPISPRERSTEPAVSSFDGVDLARAEGPLGAFREAKGLHERRVPRLDTPAPEPEVAKPAASRVDLGRADSVDSEEQAFNQAVFGEPGLDVGNDTEPDFSDDDAIEAGAVGEGKSPEESASVDDELAESVSPAHPVETGTPGQEPRFTPADVVPIDDPIVDWPPDDQRRVVALRLVAPVPERLAGRALRLALASEGFVLGKFQIFHKPDESGRAVLSAANLSKPGTFDLQTMDSQRYGGLSLFAVLPGPRPPLKAFEDLLATARNLNERLQGALQDERGGPLTPTRIATLRESLSAETTP